MDEVAGAPLTNSLSSLTGIDGLPAREDTMASISSEGIPSPTLLSAVTVNLYLCPV
jgi:hypothetical protein